MIRRPLVIPRGWASLLPLVARRKAEGYTQGEVAATIGTSRQQVCFSETGSQPITDDFIARYEAALDTLDEAVAELREAVRAERLPPNEAPIRVVPDNREDKRRARLTAEAKATLKLAHALQSEGHR